MAVERPRWPGGAEKAQSEEDLSVLHEEWHVVGPDFEDGRGAVGFNRTVGSGVPTKARVEEARVVVAKFAKTNIDRQHLSGKARRDAQSLATCEDAKAGRRQDRRRDPAPLAGVDRLEELVGVVHSIAVELNDRRVPRGAPTTGLATFKPDPQLERTRVVKANFGFGERAAVVEHQRGFRVHFA